MSLEYGLPARVKSYQLASYPEIFKQESLETVKFTHRLIKAFNGRPLMPFNSLQSFAREIHIESDGQG